MKFMRLILLGMVFIGLSHVTLRGMFPLCEAVEKGNIELLKSLLSEEKEMCYVRGALMRALILKKGEIVQLIIRRFPHIINYRIEDWDKSLNIPLIKAAESGQIGLVKCLLNNGAIVKKKYIEKISKNRGKESIVTLLSFAHEALEHAKKGDFEKTKCILQKIDCCRVRDGDRCSVAYYAVKHKNLDFLTFLKDKGVDIHLQEEKNRTLLCYAAKYGSYHIAEYLIKCGADVYTGLFRYSPLFYAVSSNNINIVRLLVNSGALVTSFDIVSAEKNKKLQEFLEKHTVFYAIEHGGFEKFRKIFDSLDIDLNNLTNNYWQTILHVAAIEGKIDIVRYALQKGVDVNKRDFYEKGVLFSPLHYSCMMGDSDIVKLLLNNGAAVNQKAGQKFLPIYYASKCGHFDIVELLVSKGSLVTDKDISIAKNEKIKKFLEKVKFNTVFDLVKQGNLKKLQGFFSKNSCDINVKNKTNKSLLSIAVKYKRYGIVKFLVDSGADIESIDYTGSTPLCYAACILDKKIAKYLLENKANANYHSIDYCFKRSPLWFAFSYNNFAMARLFLEKNADINFYYGGETLLHLACKRGEIEWVRFLLQYGADIDCKDNQYNRAIKSASKFGYNEIVRFLLNNGAKSNLSPYYYYNRFRELKESGYKLSYFVVGYDSKQRKRRRAQALQLLFGCMVSHIVKSYGYKTSLFYRFFKRFAGFEHKNKYCIQREIEDALEVEKDTFAPKDYFFEKSFTKSLVGALKQISKQKKPHFVYAGLALKKISSSSGLLTEKVVSLFSNDKKKKSFSDQELSKIAKNKQDKKGRNPLHIFAKKNPGYIAQLIACYPKEKLVKDINAYDEEGQTPLIILLDLFSSVLMEDLEAAIYAMVKAGADINKLSKDKETCPLLNACRNRVDLIPFLLQFGADPNAKGCLYRPIRITSACDEYEATKALLQKGGNLNFKTDKSPLCWSIEKKNHKMTKLLLDNKADPNDGESLIQSIESCNFSGTGLLLAYGADPLGINKANISKEHGMNAVDFINLEFKSLVQQ